MACSRFLFKTLSLAVFATSTLLMSCGGSNPANSKNSNENELRVMAYNIHHAAPIGEEEVDIDGIAHVIKRENPHLVALQEVDSDTERSGPGNQAAMLAEKLDMHYFFAKTIDYGGGDYGLAVLSKYPILEEELFLLPHVTEGSEQRVLALIKVQLPSGKEVQFGSVHLDYRRDPKDRLNQLEEIVRVTSTEELPVILAGDFNAQPDSKSMEMVYQHFKPTCSECGPTFPADNPDKTIDYVVYKDNNGVFELLENRVVEEPRASDHRPVLVVLKDQ